MQRGSNDRITTDRYAQCIEISKRVRWDIDEDVLRGREFDFGKKFLPDGLSGVGRFDFLSNDEKIRLSQIQGRTYANMFGFVERFITAKIMELTRDHWLGDQVALEAMVRFCDEEIKHQKLFIKIEEMMAEGMPDGYRFLPDPNEVAATVLEKSSWAVMALIYEIETFTQEHYRQSIKVDDQLSDLYKDVFLFHAREEAEHTIIDTLEWTRLDQKLNAQQRDRAVDELIELVGAVDGILQKQAAEDVGYFFSTSPRTFQENEIEGLRAGVLNAYRWQYIFSGVEDPRYADLIGGMVSEEQGSRISEALDSLKT